MKLLKSLLLICAVVVLFFPTVASCVEFLEEIESEVYNTEGSVVEIANRAKSCMAQIVRNDEVRISDTASSTGVFSSIIGGKGKEGHSDGLHGGDLFVSVDIEGGIISANNRVDYTGAPLIENNAKSTMTFMAKEGRFKIRHTNIQYAQKDTGFVHNTGYQPIVKAWGTGWKKAVAALEGVSAKVATCVNEGPKNEEW